MTVSASSSERILGQPVGATGRCARCCLVDDIGLGHRSGFDATAAVSVFLAELAKQDTESAS